MLFFRRDGVRVGRGDRPAVPLDARDPTALLAHLGDAVSFAEDLTAGCLMRALSPWSASLSILTGSDMRDWTASVGGSQAKPAEAAPTPAEGERLSSVVVEPVLVLGGSGGPVTLAVEWRVHCESEEAPGTRFALPADPFLWAHLPFRLRTRARAEGAAAGSATVLAGLTVEPNLCDTVVFGFLGEISDAPTPAAALARETALKRELAMFRPPTA